MNIPILQIVRQTSLHRSKVCSFWHRLNQEWSGGTHQ